MVGVGSDVGVFFATNPPQQLVHNHLTTTLSWCRSSLHQFTLGSLSFFFSLSLSLSLGEFQGCPSLCNFQHLKTCSHQLNEVTIGAPLRTTERNVRTLPSDLTGPGGSTKADGLTGCTKKNRVSLQLYLTESFKRALESSKSRSKTIFQYEVKSRRNRKDEHAITVCACDFECWALLTPVF